MKKIMAIVFLISLTAVATAQTADAEVPDSVVVVGSVVNRMTGEPEPYTVVRLLHEGCQKVKVSCDGDGMFEMPAVPPGSYLLEVKVRGWTLYQSDLMLQQSAVLNIEVITDSMRLVNLREIQIVAARSLLGDKYIASADDIRLWSMHYRNGGGDHSASVAISPDMVSEWDELDAQNGVVRALLPFGVPRKAYRYHLRGSGLKADAANSDMKNDLILNGRIRDVKVTQKKQEKN